MSNDEIPESNLHASFIILLSSFLLVWVLPKCLIWLSDVTLFETVRVGARDFYRVIVQRSGLTVRINKQKRFASYRVTLLYVKLKFWYQMHDLKQNWFHTESSFSNQMFLSLNFVWYSKRWLSAESQFSWSSEQNHSKITSHEFAYSELKDESLKWFICNPCLCFGWLFSLLYFSISDKDELAATFL